MNGYKVFFEGRMAEVRAKSMYEAVLQAREIFKPRKSKRHLVSAVLCEVGDRQVTHTMAD